MGKDEEVFVKNIFLFGTVASILICTPSFGQDYTAQVKKQLSLVKAAGQSGRAIALAIARNLCMAD